MRIRSVRFFFYTFAVLAGRGLAQPVLSVSNAPPRVEVSVGAGAMMGGPGAGFERQFRRLGFDAPDGRIELPHTSPPAPLPGAFAQIQVGVGDHAMAGAMISSVVTDTEGRPPGGVGATMEAEVLTRALLFSYRPNAWLKIGAGPALHQRSAGFIGGPSVSQDALGWVASGEAKFARHHGLEGPPAFGYVIGQYREAPALSVPAMALPAQRVPTSTAVWPAQRVSTSHWMIGLGVGFEI